MPGRRHPFPTPDSPQPRPRVKAPRSQGLGLGNFERAVRAAIADSEDKWRLLEERLVARYGAERGRLVMCAISRDDPEGDCG